MTAKRMSILLADDDPEDLELFEEIILSIEPGAKVSRVTHGKALMNLLDGYSDEELPGLIILDYNMPQMTGSELLRWLNSESRYKHITKMILSTSGSEEHIKECLDSGAKGYFVKPDNIKELEALMKKMLAMCS